MRVVDYVLVFLAVVAISVADVLLKKVSVHHTTLGSALTDPMMIGVLALYAFQIVVFLHVFVEKAELGLVGIVQTVIYAIVVVGAGVLFFKEGFSPMKITGTVLAIAGVLLMNFG